MPRKFGSSGAGSGFTVKATGRQPRKCPLDGRTDRRMHHGQSAGGSPDPCLDHSLSEAPPSPSELFWAWRLCPAGPIPAQDLCSGASSGLIPPQQALQLDNFFLFWFIFCFLVLFWFVGLFLLRTQKHILFTASYKLFTTGAEIIPLKPHGLRIQNSYLRTPFAKSHTVAREQGKMGAGGAVCRRNGPPEAAQEWKEMALAPPFMRPYKHRNSHLPGRSWQRAGTSPGSSLHSAELHQRWHNTGNQR